MRVTRGSYTEPMTTNVKPADTTRHLTVSQDSWRGFLTLIQTGLMNDDNLRRHDAGITPSARGEVEVMLARQIAEYQALFGEHPWLDADNLTSA